MFIVCRTKLYNCVLPPGYRKGDKVAGKIDPPLHSNDTTNLATWP